MTFWSGGRANGMGAECLKLEGLKSDLPTESTSLVRIAKHAIDMKYSLYGRGRRYERAAAMRYEPRGV